MNELNPFIANEATLALIKPAEQFMAKEYPDRGVPAIGYGHRILPGEHFTEITEAQAHDILLKDLAKTWAWLSPCIKVKLNPNQIGALLAFGMNNKPAAVKASTLLKKLNAGDFKNAADQFLRWNKSGGVVLGGLVKRRADERTLFLS